MLKIIRIPSRLYYDLLTTNDVDGDKLISVYCMLKKAKNGKAKFYAHNSKNHIHISGYGLLRKETTISLANLKKYIPFLVKKGLVTFEANGDVSMMGNKACNENWKPTNGKTKMIPIETTDSVFKTAYRVAAIRVHSSVKKQELEIERKQQISVLLSKANNPKNNNERRKIKAYLDLYGSGVEVCQDVVLSNKAFSELRNKANGKKATKFSGSYWKAKLKSTGLVDTERRYKVGAKMSHFVFLNLKRDGEITNRCIYKDGRIQKELSSFVSVTTVHY